MQQRSVVPEILDRLPANDPEAVRSRRDLRRINFLMGNERWVLKNLRHLATAPASTITELGAGDGHLSRQIAHHFPASQLHAWDLSPPPETLPTNLKWHQTDIFDDLSSIQGDVLIANLFLHHFEKDALQQIGTIAAQFSTLLFCEPDRARLPHFHGRLLHPCINRVTKHDLHVSIDAGFSAGEIAEFLGLNPSVWKIREQSNWRGSRRVVGCRI
ncbi:class I SAM-dependent methyltransferase [Luteolibacter pohnpeiensis]|uniref:Class I SAM-dependent methyltransferase n=1 Tax=Luteolibacter pohnpeiensis TaxID=454153 RepID=A0A934S930_9BACT|nr:class I SAM-dependent methyltransferase [Luteolibacter pohnpeiensis]MBK1881073.1 class I SAM-dependent methyltransferase [Luteolibacter pohnpeiensis]